MSLVVAAVVAGALAGLKDQAQSAVRDAYLGLRNLIVRRHGIEVGALELLPGSEEEQQSLREGLAVSGAGEDAEVLEAAHEVVRAVREHDAAAARAVGVHLDDVDAELIRIVDVKARGDATGVSLDRVRARGSIVIEGVEADGGESPAHP
ncbi:hypothetical protein ABZ896_01735 [Streptomyces sp. NPDC047072]|uniref:hypothetical protein n=1 Tax=Streptomyces sp. NPDC047072 TaxID=3154809 RepID=UPI00340D0C2C